MAQMRTGNIYGKVSDEEGNPLPGVTVTLSGSVTAPLRALTSATGVYRFLSLPPAKDYIIKAELAGFKTEIRQGIIVAVGVNVEMNLTLAVGKLEEEVTVTAISPVVDTKKTAVGLTVTQEALQSLPTARDPWVILQMAPSVVIDRENVGGAESGQQSTYVARGSPGYGNNVWALDGIVITDPAAIGASPTYFDFDAFEEMQIVVGGADVSIQTGAVGLNLVTHRGSNKVSLAGRFYVTDERFQAKNADVVAEKKAEERSPYFVGLNQINNNKDFGFSMGGPLVKDKAWLWGSYGAQDLKTLTVYGKGDDTLLTNYVAKLNIQIVPQNRFEAFYHIGGKQKWGRSSIASNPEGLYQQSRYHFGSPIFKLQDEHTFGSNLFISLKYAFTDAGFSLTPMVDRNFELALIVDNKAGTNYGSKASRYYVERPHMVYNSLLNYFNDSFLGASHDIKVGFEYVDRNAYTESVYAGNLYVTQHYITSTIDFNTPFDGTPDIPSGTGASSNYEKFKRFDFSRGYYTDLGVRALSGYVNDTITFGRFNLILGLRYDYQRPQVNPVSIDAVTDNKAWDIVDPAVKAKLDSMLPAVEFTQSIKGTYDNGLDTFDPKTGGPTGGDPYFWGIWSPRLGLTWDVTGNGKTIAKLSLASYGDYMGMIGGRWMPYGTSGRLRFYWWDGGPTGTADGKIQFNELYWYNRTAAVGSLYAPYRVFDDAGAIVATNAQWTDQFGWGWSGYDRTDVTKITAPTSTWSKDSWGSSRTLEAMLTLEREIFTDFSVAVNASYRKYDHNDRSNKYFVNSVATDPNYLARYGFQSRDWYEEQTRTVSPTITVDPTRTKWDGNTGEASQHTWWTMKTTVTDPKAPGALHTFNPATSSDYYLYKKMPDYYQDYMGVDFILNKRLSNKWMLNGSVTLQNQKAHYGDQGYWVPTDLWAIDGRDYSAYIGSASGITNQFTNSRWMVKLAGLYQFPYDINFSFNMLAREGWIIRERVNYVDYTLPNSLSRSYTSYIHPFGEFRLPTFLRLDVRVEKMIKLGDTGRIWLMADIFNALNSTTNLRMTQKDWGTYYYYGAGDARNYISYNTDLAGTVTYAYSIDAMLFPRVARFGVRFQF
jgi:hypothetical protein